jgi:hypothetical protein
MSIDGFSPKCSISALAYTYARLDMRSLRKVAAFSFSELT